MSEVNQPIGEMLRSSPPVVSNDDAAGMARELFGITAGARRLTAERDLNFHLIAADGREFVLKVTNPAEPRGVTDLQTQALLHIERENPALPVPAMVEITPVRKSTRRTISFRISTNSMRP